ncbi:MAG TPA: cation:proton antiporter [Woeseiaceae bacterium]|nr:cation:proton antiporter [Woeseiaceae bacterium]
MEQRFAEILLMLGAAVAVILAFRRLHVPSSLAYLLVGVLLGPYTAGPVIDAQSIQGLAQFGIVFLLFTIGLNFSLPQIRALRHQVLGLGTGQVALTTLVVGLLAWIAGAPAVAAFVVGAVFAQSSTTVISKQLAEQAEENSRHGRLGIALSVFQDVMAVPFVVVIPALGAAVGAAALGKELSLALAKGVLAFVLVFSLGRWVLRPFFHLVAEARSAELFTLTVLFVSLLAAWTTDQLGLSLAFGAFLAGMVLGETEFRHQVEATIRHFRDVLLGLFFVAMGMLIQPQTIPEVWHWALAGAAVLMLSKILIVALLVRWSGVDSLTAWRTGILLAVGGEFGFALLALALPVGAVDEEIAQIALNAVLFSIVLSPFLIRYNHALAKLVAASPTERDDHGLPQPTSESVGALKDHVVIFGYGRIGQNVGHVLEEEGIPFIALDLDPARVRQARLAGEPVFYGDGTDREVLKAVDIRTARLLVISHADTAAGLKALHHVKALRPDLPVMVRTRDDTHVEELRAAGATEVVPETFEAGLMIASHALLLLKMPQSRVLRRIQEHRSSRYRLLREFFPGHPIADGGVEDAVERLRPVRLPPESPANGRTLGELRLEGVVVTALVRDGERALSPSPETTLRSGDAVVLFGSPDDLERAIRRLLG